MNCSMKFKMTTVALLVGSAMQANAALYEIVEIEVPTHIQNLISENYTDPSQFDVYGVAIAQGDVKEDTALGFFDSSVNRIDEANMKLLIAAVETRQNVDGVSYREEVPFAMDPAFSYIQDYDDFRTYCFRELRYSTCDTWASVHWSPWSKERSKDYTSNALAFVEGAPNAYDNKYNNVINSLTEAGLPVGNQSVVKADQTALETRNTVVAPVMPNGDFYQSRAWKTDGSYTSGSIATSATNDYGSHHTSKAAIWDQNGNVSQIAWPQGGDRDGNRLAQGSMRDFALSSDGKTIYGVGYNTFSDDNYLNASVFVGTIDDSAFDKTTWTTKVVSGAQMKIGSVIIHSNSVVTNVNDKFVAVGEAKRSGLKPSEGAAANRLFLIEDVSADSISATFLTSLDKLFFSGAGGKMGGINNYNEIVGQVDAEDTREIDGKERRKRAFIFPYDGNESNSERRAIFRDLKDEDKIKAWFLDDLTNGSNAPTSNNQYRIVDASDINDAGVISATAIKCDGGYDSTSHNAYCGGGSKAETIVAVKLVPIAGATSADIEARPVDKAAAERKGAGLGWLSLTLLALFGFRRK